MWRVRNLALFGIGAFAVLFGFGWTLRAQLAPLWELVGEGGLPHRANARLSLRQAWTGAPQSDDMPSASIGAP